MMVIKKEFVEALTEDENKVIEEIKVFFKEQGIGCLISREVVGKGQLGLDVTMWVLVVVKDQMIIKKDIQEHATDLLASAGKMLTDYFYY